MPHLHGRIFSCINAAAHNPSSKFFFQETSAADNKAYVMHKTKREKVKCRYHVLVLVSLQLLLLLGILKQQIIMPIRPI